MLSRENIHSNLKKSLKRNNSEEIKKRFEEIIKLEFVRNFMNQETKKFSTCSNFCK